jgi:hypothetical protein
MVDVLCRIPCKEPQALKQQARLSLPSSYLVTKKALTHPSTSLRLYIATFTAFIFLLHFGIINAQTCFKHPKIPKH